MFFLFYFGVPISAKDTLPVHGQVYLLTKKLTFSIEDVDSSQMAVVTAIPVYSHAH